jgi:hypothetical protein
MLNYRTLRKQLNIKGFRSLFISQFEQIPSVLVANQRSGKNISQFSLTPGETRKTEAMSCRLCAIDPYARGMASP